MCNLVRLKSPHLRTLPRGYEWSVQACGQARAPAGRDVRVGRNRCLSGRSSALYRCDNQTKGLSFVVSAAPPGESCASLKLGCVTFGSGAAGVVFGFKTSGPIMVSTFGSCVDACAVACSGES